MKFLIVFVLALLPLSLSVSHAQQSTTEIIVTLRAGQAISQITAATGTHVLRQIPGQPIYRLQVDSGTVATALQKLVQNPGVALAETNRTARLEIATNTAASADTQLVQSMAALLDGNTINNFYGANVLQAYTDQPAMQIIGAPAIRNLSTGLGTRVAFIDTGVDTNHDALRTWLDPGIDLVGSGSTSEFDGLFPALQAWLKVGATSLIDSRMSFLLKQSMAALLDDGSGQTTPAGLPPAFGHGTLVAGIIHVVAPNARLVPIRAFDTYGNTTIFTLAEAVYRAADLAVNVMNLSFSTTEVSTTLAQSIRYAQGKGVATVASVGNESRNAAGVYPAAYPLTSGVAATDFNDCLASFSNYGSVVALTAPGSYVISTSPGGRYAMAWGTSFSAPIVSGANALVASLNVRWTGAQTTAAVINNSVSIDSKNPAYVLQLGRGRVYLPKILAVPQK